MRHASTLTSLMPRLATNILLFKTSSFGVQRLETRKRRDEPSGLCFPYSSEPVSVDGAIESCWVEELLGFSSLYE